MDFYSLSDAKKIIKNFPCPWGFCGGWGIDLFLGRETRSHKDVDIALWREDQNIAYNHLTSTGWSLQKVVGKKELIPWEENEKLALPNHQFFAKKNGKYLEFVFCDNKDDLWFFRRLPEVTRPASDVFIGTKDTPLLHPAIILLYKSKDPRPKDNQDFEECFPHLDNSDQLWLINSLKTIYKDHPWIAAHDRAA